MLTSGFTIEQPAEFASKIFALMDKAVVNNADAKSEGGDDAAPETVDPEVV